MLKSYLSTALRNLLSQKLHAAINVAGLAVGLACFILIALFVRHELSYDTHWTDAERIYRISRDYSATETVEEAHLDGMPALAAPLLRQAFPQIESVARLMCCGINGESSEGEFFTEPGYADADNALFDIFDFEWLSGDPETALTDPFDLVLTRSAARRHFGDADPLGQTLLLQWGPPSTRLPRVVKGVIEDLPDNSHLPFDMLGSIHSWSAVEATAQAFDDWSFNAFQTYILLREDAAIASLESQAGAFFENYFQEGSSAYTGFSAEKVTDIHLRSKRENIYGYALKEAGTLSAIYTFGLIAIFILLLACINFMNLATARSMQRAKEIGVRKAVGASRMRVMLQFLAESILLIVIAMVTGLALVELALPAFNAFLAKDLSVDYLGNPIGLGAILVLTLATGILAGGYPAFHLSRFQSARVLRGDVTRGSGAVFFRKTLVVLQFSISIALLIATALIFEQMRFARSIDPGYDRSQIVLSGRNVQPQRWDALKREWLAHPEITHVTASSPAPSSQTGFGPAEMRSDEPGSPMRNMNFIVIDYDFFEVYRIEFLAGRSFSPEEGDRPSTGVDGGNTTPFIISELAARQFGWAPEEALGQWLDLAIPVQSPEYAWAGDASGLVVGVVKDVYWESVHRPIGPLVYRMYREGQAGVASLRITGNDRDGTMAWIDSRWRDLGPAFPIARSFLDQDFDALYRNEQRQAQMFTFFSVVAIVVSCLGLFGLAAFSTERRTKEIGIRKVMGGSSWDVLVLFTREFAKLVLAANLLAWPVAYFLMQSWLGNFAYRTETGPFLFLGSGLLALMIACLTVGAISLRAASARPVQVLRYE